MENRVLDRLAGVGQVLADSLARLREGPAIGDIAVTPATMQADAAAPDGADDDDDNGDHPTGKVYFVEFPPYATPAGPSAYADPEAEREIVLTETPGASLFADDQERSEWAPPMAELPTWWTRDGQG